MRPNITDAVTPMHGTTVVGLKFAEGVIFAGDRRATEGFAIADERMDKVFAADGFSVIAIAGAAGQAIELVRLFQLELWRRRATGTMAEIRGPEALRADIGARLLGFRGDMDRELAHYHPRGVAIIAMVALHVGALYAYSPEDVMDALLLVAPTPFSLYGVIGLWCVILTGVLAAARRRLRLGHRRWRIAHSVLAVAIVSATAVHAVLIEGAMEEISKLAICLAALATTSFGAVEINILGPLRRRRALQGA